MSCPRDVHALLGHDAPRRQRRCRTCPVGKSLIPYLIFLQQQQFYSDRFFLIALFWDILLEFMSFRRLHYFQPNFNISRLCIRARVENIALSK